MAKTISVAGIIIANSWDHEGNVLTVQINSDDEQMYPVAFSEKGLELVKYCRMGVKAIGEWCDSRQELLISHFEVFSI